MYRLAFTCPCSDIFVNSIGRHIWSLLFSTIFYFSGQFLYFSALRVIAHGNFTRLPLYPNFWRLTLVSNGKNIHLPSLNFQDWMGTFGFSCTTFLFRDSPRRNFQLKTRHSKRTHLLNCKCCRVIFSMPGSRDSLHRKRHSISCGHILFYL
jgi:hypothetical protein